jgi:hypothetical protein
MRRSAYLGCFVLLTAALSIPITAQNVMAQDEGTAYATYYAETGNLSKRAQLGEEFLAKFKTSDYADAVFRGVILAYYQLNNWPKVMEWAAQTDQMFPKMAAADKSALYARAMNAANQSNNAAQAGVFAEKVLTATPETDGSYLYALITLVTTMTGATPQDKAAMAKAEGYAQKAVVLLEKTDGKSLGISDSDWVKQKPSFENTLHGALGGIYLNRPDYDKAVAEFLLATKAVPGDGPSWYFLGLAYYEQYLPTAKSLQEAVNKSNELKRQRNPDQALIDEAMAAVSAYQDTVREKRDQAIDALATAVAVGGPTQQQANDQLTKLYSAKNGSTDGLAQLIKSKKPPQ